MIVQGKDRYYLLYKQVKPKKGQSHISHCVYSPPRDGGQFSMPDVCMSKFFVQAGYPFVDNYRKIFHALKKRPRTDIFFYTFESLFLRDLSEG